MLSVAGFELTFWSGVYGTSTGHTQHFGTLGKKLLGLCGVFIGIGEILGKYISGGGREKYRVSHRS